MAELVVTGGSGGPVPEQLPVRISDGRLQTASGPYHNLLMLPLRDDGPVVLEIELASGSVVRMNGEAAEVRLFGEAEFIEDVA